VSGPPSELLESVHHFLRGAVEAFGTDERHALVGSIGKSDAEEEDHIGLHALEKLLSVDSRHRPGSLRSVQERPLTDSHMLVCSANGSRLRRTSDHPDRILSLPATGVKLVPEPSDSRLTSRRQASTRC